LELLLDLDKEFIKSFQKAAMELRERLGQKPKKQTTRELIQQKGIGKYRNSKKLSQAELSKISDSGGIVGVDGSTNSSRGHYPYLITVQQALAKSSRGRKDIVLSDAFSPLTQEEIIPEEEYRKQVKQNLAYLEIQAALMAIREFKLRVMLMDGSLVRFKIEAPELWEKLKEEVLSREIILVGVVESISTAIISSCLKDELSSLLSYALDWELLFGILEIGEALEMVAGLFKDEFATCFMRPSRDPKPIGLDLPQEQSQYMPLIQDLVYTLAPADGRGIPLWLDIIDRQVRVTDVMMEVLINAYLGEDYAKYLLPKRNDRSL